MYSRQLPNQSDIDELKAFEEPYCLSIYVSFMEPNVATYPNRIELKNLLREAETALLSVGAGQNDVKKTLRPARLMLENHEFWPIHHESLVLFMHPKLFRYFHIPHQKMPYMLTVEKGFNLAPLLEVMEGNKHYFVLALSHKNVHLYEGDHYQLKPVHLKHFPADMKETLVIDEYPSWRESHEIAPSYMGKGSEATHGQYNVSQTDKAMLLEFFRRIDHYLHNFLFKQQRPLIIAGVNYLLPIYRKVNTYPGLLPNVITGNQEHVDLQTIRENAWHVVARGSP